MRQRSPRCNRAASRTQLPTSSFRASATCSAATQFTAYMAMQNFVIAYTAQWQGWAAERWGYPRTLVVDCLFGLVGLSLLPLMAPQRARAEAPVGAAVPEAIEP